MERCGSVAEDMIFDENREVMGWSLLREEIVIE